MSADEHLGPQFEGDHHTQQAVEELALGHREWTGESAPLHYTTESVRPGSVRFQRYPATDSRTSSAISGYAEGVSMPPVTLVRRNGETMTVDGHHRLSAAEHLGQHVQALIAHSPREDTYTGRANTGTKRKPRKSTAGTSSCCTTSSPRRSSPSIPASSRCTRRIPDREGLTNRERGRTLGI